MPDSPRKGQGSCATRLRLARQFITENVLLEIQKTFDFFKSSATTDKIDRVLLSGGASRLDGFQKALEERFATVIEPFNPFEKIAFDAAKLGVSDPDGIQVAAAVAVGLALRTAGDR